MRVCATVCVFVPVCGCLFVCIYVNAVGCVWLCVCVAARAGYIPHISNAGVLFLDVLIPPCAPTFHAFTLVLDGSGTISAATFVRCH